MIRINDDFIITIDTYNYILQRRVGVDKKTGEPRYNPVAYCTDLLTALKAFRREYVRLGLQNGVSSLEQACAGILQSNREVEQLIQDAVGGLT